MTTQDLTLNHLALVVAGIAIALMVVAIRAHFAKADADPKAPACPDCKGPVHPCEATR